MSRTFRTDPREMEQMKQKKQQKKTQKAPIRKDHTMITLENKAKRILQSQGYLALVEWNKGRINQKLPTINITRYQPTWDGSNRQMDLV